MSDTVLAKEIFPDPPPALVKYTLQTDEYGVMVYLTFRADWPDEAIIETAKFWRRYPCGKAGEKA